MMTDKQIAGLAVVLTGSISEHIPANKYTDVMNILWETLKEEIDG